MWILSTVEPRLTNTLVRRTPHLYERFWPVPNFFSVKWTTSDSPNHKNLGERTDPTWPNTQTWSRGCSLKGGSTVLKSASVVVPRLLDRCRKRRMLNWPIYIILRQPFFFKKKEVTLKWSGRVHIHLMICVPECKGSSNFRTDLPIRTNFGLGWVHWDRMLFRFINLYLKLDDTRTLQKINLILNVKLKADRPHPRDYPHNAHIQTP